jgi:hypothetical protein
MARSAIVLGRGGTCGYRAAGQAVFMLRPVLVSLSVALAVASLAAGARADDTPAPSHADDAPAPAATGDAPAPAGDTTAPVRTDGIEPPAHGDGAPTLTTVPDTAAPPPADSGDDVARAAQSRRAWSWLTIGAGVALAGTGIALAEIEQAQVPAARSELAAVNAKWVRGSGQACDFSQPLTAAQQTTCETLLDGSSSKVDDLVARRRAGWILAGVGGAVATVGVVLLALGRDPVPPDPPQGARGTPGAHGEKATAFLSGWQLVPQVGPTRAFLSAACSF